MAVEPSRTHLGFFLRGCISGPKAEVSTSIQGCWLGIVRLGGQVSRDEAL